MNQVSLFFHGLWLLCGVGAVALTANPAPRWTGVGALALGFGIGAALFMPDHVPDPIWVGGITACVAAWLLFKPQARALAAGVGGALAALWGVLLHLQGSPLVLSMPLATAVVAMSSILAVKHAAYSPEHLREEALLVVLVLGLALSMSPVAAAGWQSAAALNADAVDAGQRAANQAVPAWTLAATVAATLLGGVYTMWMRR